MPTVSPSKRKKKRASRDARPGLIDRVLDTGCTRLAVIGLHPGAGARTVVEVAAELLHRREIQVGVTRVPKAHLESGEGGSIAGTVLPEGTLVAAFASVLEESDTLQELERIESGRGGEPLALCRVLLQGEVPVYGPDDPPALAAALARLESRCEGPVLVDGGWESRGFADPVLTQGVVLAVGCGYSGTPQRSAAAVRYAVEIVNLPACAAAVRRAWGETVSRHSPLVLDRHGRILGTIRAADPDPARAVEALGREAETVILPKTLTDTFLAPLVRNEVRFTIVVKDATRVRVAPVYFRAWLKRGGGVAVVDATRLLAVATNPTNPTGPDADPGEFLTMVAEAVPGVPVHDARRELTGGRTSWKFWG